MTEHSRHREHGVVEEIFETVLFQSRFFVLLAVTGSLIASLMMFLKGCVELIQAFTTFLPQLTHIRQTSADDKTVIISIIPAVDYYLFATVLLVFSMGIYELFISELDPKARHAKTRSSWLNIKSLDDLKSSIGKVVMMILIVNFFQQAFNITYEGPIDLVLLAASILLIGLSLLATHNIIHRATAHHAAQGEHSPGSLHESRNLV